MIENIELIVITLCILGWYLAGIFMGRWWRDWEIKEKMK